MFKFAWENLFGHEATADYLRRIIAEGNFPHAVIFSGAEGIGKRLTAQICAAALLCENPVNGSPCGTCENCRLVAAKSHPDFYVVEPEETKTARNIKIGQIRAMQTEAALRPINSERRVVILDGAELMNTAAANCLLKTIEEPPSQTIFILLTANRSSLLMTIRSRCMTINFNKLTPTNIREALIARDVEPSEAEKLSIIADGSLSRALKLKESGGAELRDTALSFVEKISRAQLTNEEIFNFGAQVADWSRDKFADFLIHVQKIIRDSLFIETFALYNSDIEARIGGIKIPEQKIFAMINIGAEFHGGLSRMQTCDFWQRFISFGLGKLSIKIFRRDKYRRGIPRRLKSNANLRLLAEAYLFRLRKIID